MSAVEEEVEITTFDRVKEIFIFFLKNSFNKDLTSSSELDDEATTEHAKKFVQELESLGPTFIKLGQVLSTRSKLFPKPYLKELSKLEDSIDPFPYEEVKELVEDELGVKISIAFSMFDSRPIAAASLGQVHVAKLRDGRDVAVKVQRPHLRNIIEKDIKILYTVAAQLDHHTEFGKVHRLTQLIREFERTIKKEIDYLNEAHNLLLLKHNLSHFDSIVIPKVFPDYTTEKVLTMELMRGAKITALHPSVHIDIDGSKLSHQLFYCYLQQILLDGVFHADPHPGNLFLTPNKKLALIDMGMVVYLPTKIKEQLLDLLLAIASDDAVAAADIALQIGEVTEFSETEFFKNDMAHMIAENKNSDLKELNTGELILDMVLMASRYSITFPSETVYIGKALLHLDMIGKILDKDFNPHEALQKYIGKVFRKKFIEGAKPHTIMQRALEVEHLIERLPRRLDKILGNLAEGKFKFKVDTLDQDLIMAAFQKVANRITIGLVIASFIIGGVMLSDRTNGSSVQFLGLPIISVLMIGSALATGVYLLIIILMKDRTSPRE